jgi:diguanylate cyclase (GGDEF)-like protein
MRRTIPILTAGGAILSGRLRVRPSEIKQTVRSQTPARGQESERRISILDRRRATFEDSVDDVVSSALMAHDKELSRILREVNQISEALKAETPDTQTLSNTLQRTVLCAVKQSLLDRELRSLALTDDLTCLYNRRAFLALAGQHLRVIRRKAQGLLLFFADVDNLKEINDLYGHCEGDRALVRAANALDQTFRNSDIIARLGGDEFAILALEASCEDREVILRRLGKILKGANADESRYELSLSVGVARFDPKHPVSLGKLIATADEAMYDEKKSRPQLAAI